jgi:predicted nucleic acid-binding protein
MRVALDTNVLAYAEGVNGAVKQKVALQVIERLPEDSTFLPVQVLGEFFRVPVGKAGRTPEQAQAAILSWQDAFPLIETSPAVMLAATDLTVHHSLGIWDAVILSATAAAGCRLLLSENLHSGFTWNGVTVTNPFLGKNTDCWRICREAEVWPTASTSAFSEPPAASQSAIAHPAEPALTFFATVHRRTPGARPWPALPPVYVPPS